MRQGFWSLIPSEILEDVTPWGAVESSTPDMKSTKVKAKLPQISFWNANCSGFFLLLRDVPISSFSFDTTHVIPVPYLREIPILRPKA